MTDQEIANRIGAVKITAQDDLRSVLRAWFEVEDYPSDLHRRRAETSADDAIRDIVRAIRELK